MKSPFESVKGGGEYCTTARRVAFAGAVTDEFGGQRLDATVVRLMAQEGQETVPSRAEVSRWIRQGSVVVDGQPIRKPGTSVRAGQRIALRAERAPRLDWRSAEPMALDIVFEDEAVIVLDKPAGLVTHPGAGNPAGTLVNGLLHHRPTLADLPRAGLVQRLDKDTSGLMVVAASESGLRGLVRAMAARDIERRYLAVVEGVMDADRAIDSPIGRHPRNRLRQAVRTDGRPALTHVLVRERYSRHSLVEARLETGRMHQIRVHLASVRHPLVGDSLYGARGLVPKAASPAALEVLRGFPRQALHAFRLAFEHPLTGARLSFRSAPPDDIEGLVDALAE